jgi:tetratricopeptide (TPR) repeat protein
MSNERITMRILRLALTLGALVFTGCIRTIAVSTVGGIVDDGFGAFTEESDLAFAEQALPGNIKLLEVMLKSDPTNSQMLRLASEGYISYALAFLEDTDKVRARDFYLRGRDFAFRILREDKELARGLDGTLDDLKSVLATRGTELVPAAFWAAFGWGSSIYLNLTSPDAIGDLPKAEALMDFVVDHDSAYYYGGAHLFLGTLYGSRPKILGGDLEKARAHFEKALRLNRGEFLMTYVYYAKSVAVQSQDEAMFEELLGKVLKAPDNLLPGARLANQVAKRKAQLLLSRKSDLF